jgi:hypothetical protein
LKGITLLRRAATYVEDEGAEVLTPHVVHLIRDDAVAEEQTR